MLEIIINILGTNIQVPITYRGGYSSDFGFFIPVQEPVKSRNLALKPPTVGIFIPIVDY